MFQILAHGIVRAGRCASFAYEGDCRFVILVFDAFIRTRIEVLLSVTSRHKRWRCLW